MRIDQPAKRQLLTLPHEIIRAPQWLKDRWAKVRAANRRNPPTIESVRRTWEASANQRDSIQRELDLKAKKGIPIR